MNYDDFESFYACYVVCMCYRVVVGLVLLILKMLLLTLLLPMLLLLINLR